MKQFIFSKADYYFKTEGVDSNQRPTGDLINR